MVGVFLELSRQRNVVAHTVIADRDGRQLVVYADCGEFMVFECRCWFLCRYQLCHRIATPHLPRRFSLVVYYTIDIGTPWHFLGIEVLRQ